MTSLILTSSEVEQLDLLLIAVEALDLNGRESILWASYHLGFAEIIPNKVVLWKLRCCNPMRYRKSYGILTSREGDALIEILSFLAERLYPILHQLLSSTEPTEIKLQRWSFFHTRFTHLLKKNMNLRRMRAKSLFKDIIIPNNERRLLIVLGLAAGDGGIQRLHAIISNKVYTYAQ
uniref:Uncharacterized protein n=1 Tax=Paulinella longichromatophora TaxID=1708747 RepID=A0A2H4ZQC2_9EUKA|nr:hypothetical protein PLO_736 [Paulinella longichromatophora]